MNLSANILVVEDDPAIRELVRLHLASANFEVRTAEDGAQGWQSVLRDPPDLIVSDIAMPNMDGFEFLSAVRKNESTSAIPLIFLTAVDDRDSFRRGMDLGADDFLNKPVRRNDLLSAISGRLKRLQGVRDSQRMSTLSGSNAPMSATASTPMRPPAAAASPTPRVGVTYSTPPRPATSQVPSLQSPNTQQFVARAIEAQPSRPPVSTKTPSSSVTQLMRAVQDDEARVKTAGNVAKRAVRGTVLFSDIRNFTTYAELLSSAETVELLNAYFGKACEPILDQNGWIVKFVGDGVIAMFDSPEGSNDHAERALKAALLMVLAAHRFKRWIMDRFPGRNLPEFAIGVGVQTGEVMVCKMGTEKASETTIIGDTVNIASRLESKTKELAWSVVAGRESVALAGARFRTRRSGQMVVKGRSEPVDIAEVIGLAPKTKASPTEQQFYDMIAQAVAANAAVTSAARKAALLEKSKAMPILRDVAPKARGDSAINIDGYRLLKKLGEGGMSVVFLATQESTGAEHVLKILRILGDEDDDILQRFIQEFALVSQIDHPNVARIHSQGFSQDHAYIAMEYFPGGDLRTTIEAGMTPDLCLAVILQVAGALGAIHARGIVHRDMKPDNVMIRADGTLALADFGIAKQLNTSMQRTKHGEVFGTPYYLSPEQALGLQVDQRSDIYSLGVMFFEMLAGKKPYRGDNPQALLYQHVNAPIPQLPDHLIQYQGLINKLMAKKTTDRVQNADEIINAVLAIINGEATTPFSLDF